jgi:glutamate dehydrogenase
MRVFGGNVLSKFSSVGRTIQLDSTLRFRYSGKRLFASQDRNSLFVEEDNADMVGIVDLMKEVAKQQQENIVNIVPWFVNNMPPDYFRNVSEKTRIQQLKALTSINDLGDSDLKLEIKTNLDDNSGFQITKVSNNTTINSLRSQVQEITAPDGYFMKKIEIFTSFDKKLALNMYTFQKKEDLYHDFDHKDVTMDEISNVMKCIADTKAGKFAGNPTVPEYSEELFGESAMHSYVDFLRPEYVSYMRGDTRRFLIHKKMWNEVQATDGSTVHIEENQSKSIKTDGHPSYWLSIAGANVLPEVILRLSTSILGTRDLDILDARLDFIECENNRTTDMPGAVTLLQLLVTGSATKEVDVMASEDFQKNLKKDLKRSKWIDVNTFHLGLYKHPSLGIERSEVIMAYCSMLHSVLYQIDSQNYASIQSVVESISRPLHLRLASDIADLFLDRFNPNLALSDEEFQTRADEIKSKIAPLGYAAGRTVLDKFLDALHTTLRTNFYNEDRYALSMRMDPKVMFILGPSQNDKDNFYGEQKN